MEHTDQPLHPSDSSDPPFGDILRELRRAAGWTQAELAERAGLSLRGIADLERGVNRHPQRETLLALAEAFGLADQDRIRFFEAARRRRSASGQTGLGDPSAAIQVFLIADVRGYTTYTFEHSDEDAARLAQRFADLAGAAVQAYGGQVLEVRGDEVLAVFSSARVALRAALALQEQVEQASRTTPDQPIRCGIGVEAGEAVPVGSGYRGIALNLAARLCAHAGPREVLAGETVIGLARRVEGLRFQDRGLATLKGFASPVRLTQVLAAEPPISEAPTSAKAQPSMAEPANSRADVRSTSGRYTSPVPERGQRQVHHLLIPRSPLLAREADLASLTALLRREDVRLVTLTGTGGVGKTRLAQQVAMELAEEFSDDVYYVSLAPLESWKVVASTIAQCLGLNETSSQTVEHSVCEHLTNKHLLLVLDNFEHVLPAATVLSKVLNTCGRVKVLVTSRDVLRLGGEQRYPLAPLSVPPRRSRQTTTAQSQDSNSASQDDVESLCASAAGALFIARITQVQPGFRVTMANAPALIEICRRLDGLPLALELAAARIPIRPPAALLADFDRDSILGALAHGPRDAPQRHQTLQATIAWSYHLLAPTEQRLFRWLAVFAGGCRLEEARRVCGLAAAGDRKPLDLDVSAGIASLVEKSLVVRLEDTAQPNDPADLVGRTGQESLPGLDLEREPRYGLLETIREYALERLAAAGERDAARRAHTACYLALAEKAAPALRGPQHATWIHRLAREYDNLRASMACTLEQVQAGADGVELAVRMGEALEEFWSVRGLYSEAWAFLEAVASACVGVPPALRVRVLRAAGDFPTDQHLDRAEALWQETLAIYRELEDKRGIAYALSRLAFIGQHKGGNYSVAPAHLEEWLALARELGDKEDIASALTILADTVGFLAQFSRVRLLFEEGLALWRELGDKKGLAFCLRQSVMWLLVEHDPRDQPTMRNRLDECLALYQQSGDQTGLAFCAWLNGWIALDQGYLVTAETQLEQSLALWRATGESWRAVFAHTLLGRVATQQRDFANARAIHLECLKEAGEFTDHMVNAFCLDALAQAVAAEGLYAWAARIWGAADAEREQSGVPRALFKLVDYETNIAAVRSRLGEPAFAAAWAKGQTLTLAQIVAEAQN